MVKKCGAEKVYIIATHGVLSADSVKEIQACSSVYKVKVHNLLMLSYRRLELTHTFE